MVLPAPGSENIILSKVPVREYQKRLAIDMMYLISIEQLSCSNSYGGSIDILEAQRMGASEKLWLAWWFETGTSPTMPHLRAEMQIHTICCQERLFASSFRIDYDQRGLIVQAEEVWSTVASAPKSLNFPWQLMLPSRPSATSDPPKMPNCRLLSTVNRQQTNLQTSTELVCMFSRG